MTEIVISYNGTNKEQGTIYSPTEHTDHFHTRDFLLLCVNCLCRQLKRHRRKIIPCALVLLLFQSMGFDRQQFTAVQSNPSEWKNWTINSSQPLDMMTNSTAVATIIIHMSGEMGNHINHIAHAYPIAWWAKRKYGIKTRMIIRDQVIRGRISPKSGSVKTIFMKCFPHLQTLYDGPRANSPEYGIRIAQQHAWDMANDTVLEHINNDIRTESDVDVTLEHLQLLVQSDSIPVIDENATIILPLLMSIRMENALFVDWFYHDLRWLLTFNDTACCKALPDADETVLHYRNFGSEMPKRGIALGFEELSPRKISEELLRNLTTGDKVAITSRFINTAVEDIVNLLSARGIQVRVVNGQSPEEDFCFLSKAEKELVGFAKSSYVRWAGILGNASVVRMYSVDSPATRRISQNLTMQYTNPLLSMIRYERFNSEEMDDISNFTGTRMIHEHKNVHK